MYENLFLNVFLSVVFNPKYSMNYPAASGRSIKSEFIFKRPQWVGEFNPKRLNAWNITDNQLEFLVNTLDSNYADVNNIFIFLHELICWSPDNEYQNIEINYVQQHRMDISDFQTGIYLLKITTTENTYLNKIVIN